MSCDGGPLNPHSEPRTPASERQRTSPPSLLTPHSSLSRRAKRAHAGLSIVEVLIASVVLGLAMVPMMGLFQGGTRRVQKDAEKVMATFLAHRLMEEVMQRASEDPSSALSHDLLPLVGEAGQASPYLRDILGVPSQGLSVDYPELAQRIQPYQAAVTVENVPGRPGLKQARVRIVWTPQGSRTNSDVSFQSYLPPAGGLGQ